MASSSDYKDSFFKMANSAISASKTGWTRAKQYTEEQMGSAEKTEYVAHFSNQIAKAERTKLLTEKLLRQTEAMIQPNPGVRVEEFLFEKLDKKNRSRPTNIFVLGETMHYALQDVGPETAYGVALGKVGTGLKKMGNAEKDFMQKCMSHYLHPLKSFLDIEMKTISKEKRMLDVKRLDLDACRTKVRKATTAEKMRETEYELRQAQSDFDKQLEVTNLLLEGITTAHANHLSSLQSFVEALGMYHTQCQQYVTEIQKDLQLPIERPVRPSLPSAPPGYSAPNQPSSFRRAKVLYDYDAIDQSELSLIADEIVKVYAAEGLGEDWMMAERGTMKGKVPVSFLEFLCGELI